MNPFNNSTNSNQTKYEAPNFKAELLPIVAETMLSRKFIIRNSINISESTQTYRGAIKAQEDTQVVKTMVNGQSLQIETPVEQLVVEESDIDTKRAAVELAHFKRVQENAHNFKLGA